MTGQQEGSPRRGEEDDGGGAGGGAGHAAITAWWLANYPDPEVRVVRSLPRKSGALYQLEAPHRCGWLRVGGVLMRSLTEVEAEAEAASTLIDRAIRLSRPLIRRDGRFAGLLEHNGKEQVVLAYQHVPGDEPPQLDRRQAEALGQLVADLHGQPAHEVSPGHALPAVEPIRGAREAARLARRWLGREDAIWLESTVGGALTRLEQLGVLDRPVICHGDLRLPNVRFAGSTATLIDLEALGRGPRSYDLACLWRRRVVEADFTTLPEDWSWFRQGYQSALGLEDEEWQALPQLALLRAVWTMSLPAQPGATWGTAWMLDPDYWAAHLRMVRWFAATAV